MNLRTLSVAFVAVTAAGAFGVGGSGTTVAGGRIVAAATPTGGDEATAVGIDGQGRIVATNSRFAVVRYEADGSADRTFGHDGQVIAPFQGEFGAAANAVTIDSQGRIVVAGSILGGVPTKRHDEAAVVRYKPNGDLDKSFGSRGRVTTSIGSAHGPGSNRPFVANSVAIDGQGRIVIAGIAVVDGQEHFALARYKPNGDLDPSFGSSGKLTTKLSYFDFATAVAIDQQGRVIAAGSAYDPNTGGELDKEFALARYEEDGTLDPSFGEGGKVTTSVGVGSARGMTIDASGRIVLAGTDNDYSDFAVVRYNADGSLDATFSHNGRFSTTIGPAQDIASGVAIDSEGRVVAAGVTKLKGSQRTALALARIRPGGTLDPTFGTAGTVVTSFSPSPQSDGALTLAIDSAGRIVTGGFAGETQRYGSFLALARYEPDGILDPSFGTSGLATTSFAFPPTIVLVRAAVNSAHAKATFTFSGYGYPRPLRYECALDSGRYHACNSPKTYKHLKVGKHAFSVRAVDASGARDPSPTVISFRIKR